MKTKITEIQGESMGDFIKRNKGKVCVRCGFEKGSEKSDGCYIGIPLVKISKYHKYEQN